MTMKELGVASILAGALLFSGCGHHEKHPLVTLSSSVTPTYNGSATSNVDVIQDFCTSGTSSGTSEFFADHNATATFLVSIISPSLTPDVTVTIDRYSIAYASLADSATAPPIQSATIDNSFVIPASGSNATAFEGTVSLVDLVRKVQYVADINSGAYGPPTYLNNYRAIYTFEGHDNTGAKFTTSAAQSFEMGNFNECGQ